MFVLVLFEDEVFLICEPNNVSNFRTRCPAVMYTDGRKYTARIIAMHESRDQLEEIQTSLSSGVHSIELLDVQHTNECLPYSKILSKHKESQGTSKLYLDSSLVLSPGENGNYFLSFRRKKRTKTYFDKQPDLVEIEIWRSSESANVNIALPESIISIENGSDTQMNKDGVVAKTRSDEAIVEETVIEETILKEPIFLKNGDESFIVNATNSTTSDFEKSDVAVTPLVDAENSNVDETMSIDNSLTNSSKLPSVDPELDELNGNRTVILQPKCKYLEDTTERNQNDLKIDENSNNLAQGVVQAFHYDMKDIVFTEFPNTMQHPSPQPRVDTISQVDLEIDQRHVGESISNPLDKSNGLDYMNLHRDECVDLKKIGEPAPAGSDCDDIFDAMLAGHYYTPGNINISSLPENLLPPIISSTMLDSAVIDSKLLDTTRLSIDETANEKKDEDSDAVSEDASSGEDYVPSSPEKSDADSEVERCNDDSEVPDQSRSRKKTKENRSTLNITLRTNQPGFSAPDDATLTVQHSKTTAAYMKKHFCVYCQKFQAKIARHLESIHGKEKAVKEFAALNRGDKKRIVLIAKIRKAGDNLYNTDPRFNDGNLLVVRRPQQRMDKKATDFIACGKCKGQYNKSVIRHHWKKCTEGRGGKERLTMVKGRKVSGRVHAKASAIVRKHIFPYMREDDIVRGIRYDELIILYANKQTEKYGTHQHHYQMIRARLRLLGRLLLQVKSVNPIIKNFADIFVPRHYDDTIRAVKVLAGMNEDTRTFDHPATASNIGTLMKHVGELLRSEYIKSERAHDQKRVEDFLKLQTEDYTTSINRAVAETQMQQNRRKKVILPSVDDITKLHDFLKSERDRYFKCLQQVFSKESWQRLAEASLISLQVFNRRRPGEIERVYLEDFDSYQSIDKITDKDAYEALTKEGQALARKYVRFMIRGKRGRGVPVLVPSEIFDCLTLIKRHRSDAGVSANNPYLFGVPSVDADRSKYLRACDLMRFYAAQCGAAVPTALRGTQLRKHIATRCINLNLSENQVSDLANFMGHHENIHKQIYRQPVIENDIVKISQLLEIAQGTHPSTSNDNESSSSEEEENATNDDQQTTTDKIGISEVRGGNKSIFINRGGHRRWSKAEKDVALSAFDAVLRSGRMPSGEQMQTLIQENECLRGRAVPQFRTWLHTQKKKFSA